MLAYKLTNPSDDINVAKPELSSDENNLVNQLGPYYKIKASLREKQWENFFKENSKIPSSIMACACFGLGSVTGTVTTNIAARLAASVLPPLLGGATAYFTHNLTKEKTAQALLSSRRGAIAFSTGASILNKDYKYHEANKNVLSKQIAQRAKPIITSQPESVNSDSKNLERTSNQVVKTESKSKVLKEGSLAGFLTPSNDGRLLKIDEEYILNNADRLVDFELTGASKNTIEQLKGTDFIKVNKINKAFDAKNEETSSKDTITKKSVTNSDENITKPDEKARDQKKDRRGRGIGKDTGKGR
ncbi:hypothetical protein [Aquimarina sp. MMG016]|uniref:hypothetical protein n=1 Tax=Aquimarina sp. MMG016 TaxID=2822690 RepID=UPI001B3A5B5D|nr:hypothetical protein [Aquimarina sp. MMG016]MBQ4820598.1 hypothetical protein [Aquimarina sp. MMG016]